MNTRQNPGQFVAGIVLIGIGILALLGNLVRFDIWHYAWPLLFVGFGIVFFAGMVSGGKPAGGLAIPGTLFIVIGILMFFQNAFNYWQSWAYTWTLVGPTSVGIGLMIFGWWSNRPDLSRSGRVLTIIGLLMFVVAGALYETSVGLFGFLRAGNIVWPMLLILLGVLLLFGQAFRWFFPPDRWSPGAPPPYSPSNPNKER